MNELIITGNLTKDCRIGQTPNGKSVCNFTVANTVGFGDKTHTEFIECAVWGKSAEGKLPKYLTKGQYVLVRGEACVKTREYEGKTYANLHITFAQVELLGSSNASNDAPQAQNQTSNNAPQAQNQAHQNDDFDDDLQF